MELKLPTQQTQLFSVSSCETGYSGIQDHIQKVIQLSVLLAMTCFVFTGCGSQGSNSQANRSTSDEATTPVVPPTVSIDAPLIQLDVPDENTERPQQTAMVTGVQPKVVGTPAEAKRSDKGSVQWLLEEIALQRVKGNSAAPQAGSATPGEQVPAEQIAEIRAEANRKIIELAQQVIVKTHTLPDHLNSFNTAVLALSDARLQLAIAGDSEQARLLGEDADALYSKAPNTFAATEAAFKLLQFTQLQAQTMAAKDSKWALAFARQARLFADKFPKESSRAAIHLVAAGRICDKVGLMDEAKNCLMVVEERFPNSPFADQVKNSLRRLRLPGQELMEFGGSTIDGKYLSIEQFRGRPVIIAFWASNSVIFKEDMRLINDIVKSLGSKAAIIGVNLDRDELAAERFIGMNNNDWPHIFYSAPAKRGMENLIAKYYGVTKVPSYWLLDQNGIVKSVNVKPTELGKLLTELNATE